MSTYYFDKRGEVIEIQQNLKTAIEQKDFDQIKQNIQKALIYMSLGIDCSLLFPEMLLACNTKEIVLKKLIYLFMRVYHNNELSMMIINTLLKDFSSSDPIVRGLAIRALCSLGHQEYSLPCLQKAVRDVQIYVRRSSVMFLSNFIKEKEIEEILLNISYSDKDVGIYAILTLFEKDKLQQLDKQMLYTCLLNRLGLFKNWEVFYCVHILTNTKNFEPNGEEDVVDLLNFFDVFLTQNFHFLTLSISKLFLKWTASKKDYHEMLENVFFRIKNPIFTCLASSTSPEISFEISKFILEILEILSLFEGRENFKELVDFYSADFCHFLPNFEDPPFLIKIKLKILLEIYKMTADEKLYADVLFELREGFRRDEIFAKFLKDFLRPDDNFTIDFLLQILLDKFEEENLRKRAALILSEVLTVSSRIDLSASVWLSKSTESFRDELCEILGHFVDRREILYLISALKPRTFFLAESLLGFVLERPLEVVGVFEEHGESFDRQMDFMENAEMEFFQNLLSLESFRLEKVLKDWQENLEGLSEGEEGQRKFDLKIESVWQNFLKIDKKKVRERSALDSSSENLLEF